MQRRWSLVRANAARIMLVLAGTTAHRSPLTTVSPGGKLPLPATVTTVLNAPFRRWACKLTAQDVLTVQEPLLLTVAVQWTEPSRLQVSVTSGM